MLFLCLFSVSSDLIFIICVVICALRAHLYGADAVLISSFVPRTGRAPAHLFDVTSVLYIVQLFSWADTVSLLFPLQPAIIVWRRPTKTTLLRRCDVSINTVSISCMCKKKSICSRTNLMQSLPMIKQLHSYLQRNILCIRSDCVKLFIEL